jgi:hypothetical protein
MPDTVGATFLLSTVRISNELRLFSVVPNTRGRRVHYSRGSFREAGNILHESPARLMALHADNFHRIEFEEGFGPIGSCLSPCNSDTR